MAESRMPIVYMLLASAALFLVLAVAFWTEILDLDIGLEPRLLSLVCSMIAVSDVMGAGVLLASQSPSPMRRIYPLLVLGAGSLVLAALILLGPFGDGPDLTSVGVLLGLLGLGSLGAGVLRLRGLDR